MCLTLTVHIIQLFDKVDTNNNFSVCVENLINPPFHNSGFLDRRSSSNPPVLDFLKH